jgi:hypothetical protein
VTTILVAYDDPASQTLGRAADYAEQLGATLIVTNVVPPNDGTPDAERLAQERLEQARSYLEGRGLSADLVPTKGTPADAIVSPRRVLSDMPETNDPRLAIAGLLIGILVGMTGMGGGSLMTPMLILFFKFDPAIAVGTDILHGAIFKSFGAARHRRLGTVRLRLGLWMLVGSAPMSLVGVWTVGYLTRRYGDGVDSVQGKILAIMLIVGGLAFLAKAIMHPVGPQKELGHLSNRDRTVAVCIGAVGGFVVGLTSVGSGTLFGLAMLIAFP